MSIMFQYNQEQAVTAGESSYIAESGAYAGRITSAVWTRTQNGAQGLELSFEAQDGRKANYITIYHTKKDGTPNGYGQAHINAVMGLLGLQQLTAVMQGQDYICPELAGKPLGIVLQKVLTTKQDGSDSYKFDLVVAFHPQTRQTLKELVEQTPAARVAQIAATLKDKDERTQAAPHNHYAAAAHTPPPPPRRQAAPHPAPVQDIDDNVPF